MCPVYGVVYGVVRGHARYSRLQKTITLPVFVFGEDHRQIGIIRNRSAWLFGLGVLLIPIVAVVDAILERILRRGPQWDDLAASEDVFVPKCVHGIAMLDVSKSLWLC